MPRRRSRGPARPTPRGASCSRRASARRRRRTASPRRSPAQPARRPPPARRRPRAAGRPAAPPPPPPRLGPPAPVESVTDADLPRVRRAFADAPYLEGGPAVRAALSGGDRPTLLLAAHHGALAGLGLVALLGTALRAPVSSSVRGVPNTRIEGLRPATVVGRLAE